MLSFGTTLLLITLLSDNKNRRLDQMNFLQQNTFVDHNNNDNISRDHIKRLAVQLGIFSNSILIEKK